jgi:amino acid transporter
VQITNRAAPWLPSGIYTGITLFAVANTALLNYVMGSRMLYGMSCQGMPPRILGKVHVSRHTPHIAILVLMVIVIALALVRDISQLAAATALLLLTCFMVVNAALIVLKLRPNEPRGAFEVPWIVPLLGMLVCGALVVVRIITTEAGWKAPAVAGALIVGIAVLYLILRPRNITEEALAAVEEET